MLPYYALLILVVVLGYWLCEKCNARKYSILFLCIVTAVMVTLAWIRAPSVGYDTKRYAEYFTTIAGQDFSFIFSPNNIYRSEPGFTLLNFLASRITQDSVAGVGIISCMIIVLRAIAIFKNSTNYWLSMFIYVSFGFFGYAMCTLRQELGISIFLFAIPYLQNKKPIPYFLIVLLAGTIHKSMYFLIPVYFLANIKPTWKVLSIYGAGTVFILLFSKYVLNLAAHLYPAYEFGSYYTQGRDLNTAFIPLLLFLVAILLKNRLLERNPKNVVYINFIAYAAFLFIVTIKHFIFQRFALILLPAALFLIPELLNCMQPNANKLKYYETLKAVAKKSPQQSVELIGLKSELRDAQTWYRATIGFILFGGTIYLMFLLNLNRLGLVPYVTLFTSH